MLKELYIENLAVIEKASIDFTSGVNVFTGETGAGKSILINGINAVLGQRITKDIVRNGEKKAVITAVFDGVPKDTLRLLEESGICCEGTQRQRSCSPLRVGRRIPSYLIILNHARHSLNTSIPLTGKTAPTPRGTRWQRSPK